MRYRTLNVIFSSRWRALGLMMSAFVALFFCVSLHAQAAADNTTLRIQILNGRTGRPVTNQHFLLLRKDGHALDGIPKAGETTDGEGYASLPNGDTSVPTISVSVERFRPCSKTDTRSFSLAKVRATGFVSENSCRPRITMYPQPGTLIFFVRPETFIEKMRH